MIRLHLETKDFQATFSGINHSNVTVFPIAKYFSRICIPKSFGRVLAYMKSHLN